MFRVAICDDNQSFINVEKYYIISYFEKNEIEYECSCFISGEELLSLNDNLLRYDLFLLDYELTGINGFNLANEIYRIFPNARIAFSTSFYDFTKEGYKYNAVRYLVKQDISFKEDLFECIEYVIKKSTQQKPLELKTIYGNQFIDPKQIVYIKSKGHYLFYSVYDSKKDLISEVICRGKLNDAMGTLDTSFIRIQQSVVVNLKYEILVDHKSMRVKTTSKEEIVFPIARGRFEEIRRSICRYKGTIL